MAKLTKLKWTEQEANKLIKEFTENGLIKKGWKFAWCQSIYTLARCRYKNKTIYLSRYVVQAPYIRKSKIKEILIHELAHAACPQGTGHGQIWKNKCIEFGIKPQRTYVVNITLPAYFKGICPDCKTEYTRYRRSKYLDNGQLYCTMKTCKQSKPVKWRLMKD